MDDVSFKLSDFIADDAPCRIIERMVWELDTRALEATYHDVGQKAYHPKMMLSIIFFGYTQGLRSGAKLEKACRNDLRFIYLSRSYRPSRTTFNDFRLRHRHSFADLFVQVVQKGYELGLIDLDQGVFGDGSKIRANASSKRSKTQASYEKWLVDLQTDVNEADAQSKRTDEPSQDQDQPPSADEQLPDQQQLIDKITDRLDQFEKPDAPQKINLTDPDARLMRGKKGYKDAFYNPQIVVSSDQFIIHNHISTSSSDRQQLQPGLEGIQRNLGQYPKISAWDCGYSSFANEVFLDKHQLEAYIPDQDFSKSFRDRPYHRHHFQYDPLKDLYICPQGQPLVFWRHKNDKGSQSRVYQGTQCHNCPVKDQCTKAKARTVQRDLRQPLREQMYHRLLTTKGRAIFAKRKHTVEPVFGHLKHNLGYRQFLLRSLEKVQAEFNIMCIAFNLMKMVHLATKNTLTGLFDSCSTFLRAVSRRLNSIVNELLASFYRCFMYMLFYNVND